MVLQVEMFVNVWKNHGKNVNEELKQRSIAPKQVIFNGGYSSQFFKVLQPNQYLLVGEC